MSYIILQNNNMQEYSDRVLLHLFAYKISSLNPFNEQKQTV